MDHQELCCSKNERTEEPETPSEQISQSILIGKRKLSKLDLIHYTSAGKEDYRSSYTNSKADDPRRT